MTLDHFVMVRIHARQVAHNQQLTDIRISACDRYLRVPYTFLLLTRAKIRKKKAESVTSPPNARGGEKIRQIGRFAESDKELARFYRENA